ncbi:DUF4238 domain-containing protein [Chryseobacterium carnipullorum]|uniref:DUF4238 domain-containing protein n=1 Tax=Chryseobacterium carnipullorum TaxID=1124835 RepID=UPI000E8F3390|nr:DUF4238 domain-containing protein [Chryseobacterium carnipullorum]HBV15798.1 hypothetical protein [Chryseobacterium carnipullorum]
MTEIKKRHHYIWREYLRNWSTDEKINSLLLQEKKILTEVNLVNVAQEKFFYQLEEFTEEEEIILFELVKSWSNEATLEMNLEIYKSFTSYSKLKKSVEENLKLNANNNLELKSKLDAIRYNGIENIHTLLESFGKKIIAVKSLEDLKFLDDQQELFLTMIFIAFQYLRTKKMHTSVENVINANPLLSAKYVQPFSFIYATALAHSLTFHKDLTFTILENLTSKEFITSDQPLMNLEKDIKDINNNVINFKLYYPINPRLAVIIDYDDKRKETYILKKPEEKEVGDLNSFIFKNSDRFIFSQEMELLEYYKTCL